MDTCNNHKIALELFSGSKTVSSFFESLGWNSFSVDINAKFKPTLCKDILQVSKNDLPGMIDFFWASPVCKNFSRASKASNWVKNTIKYRVYDYLPITDDSLKSIKMLEKTIEILSFFRNVPFVIENPIGRIQHTAALKKLGHYRYYVNYFDFGFPYSKETYLFSNLMLPFSTKKITVKAPGLCTVHSEFQRSKVPERLIAEIFKYIPYY